MSKPAFRLVWYGPDAGGILVSAAGVVIRIRSLGFGVETMSHCFA